MNQADESCKKELEDVGVSCSRSPRGESEGVRGRKSRWNGDQHCHLHSGLGLPHPHPCVRLVTKGILLIALQK